MEAGRMKALKWIWREGMGQFLLRRGGHHGGQHSI
jgi:hypothetical protein